MEKAQEIPHGYIQPLPEVQPRAKLSDEKIEEYAKLMEEGVKFPPVVVFSETENVYILADGFHRFRAAKKAGHQTIACIVKPGSIRNAQLFALRANAEHGLPLTQAEKRAAVKKLCEEVACPVLVFVQCSVRGLPHHLFFYLVKPDPVL